MNSFPTVNEQMDVIKRGIEELLPEFGNLGMLSKPYPFHAGIKPPE